MRRRDFIKSAGAFSAWAGLFYGRAFAVPHATCSTGRPNLTIGMISDIHVRGVIKKGEWRYTYHDLFRKALEWYRDQGVDAVSVSGDMTEYGFIKEMEKVGETWFSVFPDNKAPDGRRVEPLFVTGNHDFEGYRYRYKKGKKLFGDKLNDHIVAADFEGVWKRVFGEDFHPVWRKEVKGYTFVGANWMSAKCRGKNEKGAAHAAQWFKDNASLIGREKPFFYLQHPPVKNTAHGSWLWGHDNGLVGAELSAFDNAIAVTGHSHASLSLEKAIWQDKFVSIDAGSLKYTGLHYSDMALIYRENDTLAASGAERSKRLMKPIDVINGHQGMLVRVYDDRIVFERRDFEDMSVLGPDWVLPLNGKGEKPFAFAPRASSSKAPEFAPDAKLTAAIKSAKRKKTVVKALEVVIPPVGPGGGRVFDYEIEISGSNGETDRKYVIAEGFNRSRNSQKANSPTVLLVALDALKATGNLNIKVFARNSFNKGGKPIQVTRFDNV